ncbi:MAG: hypothetical protein EOM66_04755 [Clostridia bacterium]|nr:hypothetical protein [Clostridia bacterium]
MFFDANNKSDEIIEGGDNSGSGEAIETMDYDGGDEFTEIEEIDYGDSGEGYEGGGDGSSFNLGRFVFVALIVLLTAILAGYGIFSWYRAEQYKKWDALEPSTRTYAEFAEVFNECMEPQGISIDVEPMWRSPASYRGLTAASVMALPDGRQAPCGVELWGLSAKKDYILRLIVLLPKEQAQYVEPVVRGGFSVFAPESNEQNSEDFVDIIAASKSAFEQYPYEKDWYLISDVNFTMLFEEPEFIILEWRIPSIHMWLGQ